MRNIKEYLSGIADLETLDVSTCAYLCEIAKELHKLPDLLVYRLTSFLLFDLSLCQ